MFSVFRKTFSATSLKILLFFIFLGFSLYLIFIRNQYESFSTINVDQQSTDIVYNTGRALYMHQRVTGEFTAQDNYLGIIQFRFNTFNRINNDTLIFRLKEKNSPNWQVINKYKTDQFQWNNAYFPFGFPVFANSKGKQFQFSIESLYGKKSSAVALDVEKPVLITQYVFPLHQFIRKPFALGYFLIKKINFILHEEIFLPTLFLDLLPVLLYLELIVDISGLEIREKAFYAWKINRKTLITVSSSIGFIVYVFFLDQITDSILLIQLMVWLLLLYIYKFSSAKSFLIALFLLLTLPFFIMFNGQLYADKIADTIYMLLFVGIVQDVSQYIPIKKWIQSRYEK